jgi:hypothetical protein
VNVATLLARKNFASSRPRLSGVNVYLDIISEALTSSRQPSSARNIDGAKCYQSVLSQLCSQRQPQARNIDTDSLTSLYGPLTKRWLTCEGKGSVHSKACSCGQSVTPAQHTWSAGRYHNKRRGERTATRSAVAAIILGTLRINADGVRVVDIPVRYLD